MEYYEQEFSRVWYDKLIEVYKNFDWEIDYEILSENPNISWEIVLEHELEDQEYKNPWNYSYLTLNKNISWSIIEYNLTNNSHTSEKDIENKIWDFYWITQREDIDIEFIKKNIHLDWNFDWLSFHPKITWDFIKENSEIPWNYKWMAQNPNITWDIIINEIIPYFKSEINTSQEYVDFFTIASKNLNITWDIIISDLKSKNPKPWNFKWLSQRKDITIDIVKEINLINSDFQWDYRLISDNSNIKWEDIQNEISCDGKFTFPFVLEWLCNNPNLIWENFKKLEHNLNYNFLSRHHNITLEDIKSTFKEKDDIYINRSNKNKWNSIDLSLNRNINWDIIMKLDKDKHFHIDWVPDMLLLNPMTKWKNEFISERKRIRESFKKEIIEITSQPGYFFKNVLTKQDILEMGFSDPDNLIFESSKYKVDFKPRI